MQKPADLSCDGHFCTVVQNFEIPSGDKLQHEFFEYLHEHGAERGIYIGTKAQIQSRVQCSFCHFVVRGISRSRFPNAPDESQCFVQISKQIFKFFFYIRMPEYAESQLLSLYDERILLASRLSRIGAETARIVDETRLDYNRVKTWLNMCDTLHHDVCPASDRIRLGRASTPSALRVVDIKDDRLVDIPWTEPYVALSYVWGNATPPLLLKNELLQFSTIGSLTHWRTSMPKTIQDVMILTAGLGLRYVWFDSLCLIQDNKADLIRGIMNMDLVYETAYVTVIAANGSGADSGLPGVGQTPREVEQDIVTWKPGLEIMRVLPLDTHLNSSVWASRGWTMQEQHLSRRTLNFVNNQVYFRCRSRIWCEETWSELDPKLHDNWEWTANLVALAQEGMDLDESAVAPHNYLFTAVQRFQHRDLTDENDAINAMMGILHRVAQKANTAILEGLPVDLFPLTLNFLHLDNDTSHRRSAFPSWSWAGWTGGRPFWYAFDALHFEEHPEEIDHALEATCICIRSYNLPRKGGEGDSDLIWRRKPSTSSAAYSVLSIFRRQTLKFIESQTLTTPVTRPYTMLSMTAMTLYLKAKRPASDIETTTQKTWALLDRNDNDCGFLYHDTDVQLDSDQILMLLVLSRCYRAHYPVRGYPIEEGDEFEGFWVMFVVAMEDGVHERRGIGQVLETCIPDSCEPGLEWRKIVLG